MNQFSKCYLSLKSSQKRQHIYAVGYTSFIFLTLRKKKNVKMWYCFDHMNATFQTGLG